jgi:hypothetical protein
MPSLWSENGRRGVGVVVRLQSTDMRITKWIVVGTVLCLAGCPGISLKGNAEMRGALDVC